MTVGIDEVGRGSWAGPLCVAAVAWPSGVRVRGLADSKLVPADKRPSLAATIRLKAADIGIGWASAQTIDSLGMSAALKIAAEQALAQISVAYDTVVVDGNFQLVKDPRAVTKIKADASVPAVMAASLVAKVARDSYMHALDGIYQNYKFVTNVGYGTKQHQALLAQFGPCAVHRFSYAPLKQFIV